MHGLARRAWRCSHHWTGFHFVSGHCHDRLSPEGVPLASRPRRQVKDAEANLLRRLRLSLFPNRSGSTSLGTRPHLGWNLRCDQGAVSGFAVLPAHAPPSFAPSLLHLARWLALSRAIALSQTESHTDRLNQTPTERDRGTRTHARTHTHTHSLSLSLSLSLTHTHTSFSLLTCGGHVLTCMDAPVHIECTHSLRVVLAYVGAWGVRRGPSNDDVTKRQLRRRPSRLARHPCGGP